MKRAEGKKSTSPKTAHIGSLLLVGGILICGGIFGFSLLHFLLLVARILILVFLVLLGRGYVRYFLFLILLRLVLFGRGYSLNILFASFVASVSLRRSPFVASPTRIVSVL